MKKQPRRPKRMAPDSLDYQVRLLEAHVSRMEFDNLKGKEKMARESRRLARKRKASYIA